MGHDWRRPRNWMERFRGWECSRCGEKRLAIQKQDLRREGEAVNGGGAGWRG